MRSHPWTLAGLLIAAPALAQDAPAPAAAPAPAPAQNRPAAGAPAADAPKVPSRTLPRGPVLSSHQIDRYDAIRQLNADLKSDPKNLANWVILAELSQEVAHDLPADQAEGYYRQARDAYDHAVALDPNNQALKAAAQFAKDQEAGAAQFGQSRRQLTNAYLTARRNELGQARTITPAVPVYAGPVADTIPSNTARGPADGAIPGPGTLADGAVVEGAAPGVARTIDRTGYGNTAYPAYRPIYTGQGQPYTYQQYSQSYFPNYPQNTQPMTLRQYTSQLPQVLGNEAVRGVQRATGVPAAGPSTVPPR